MQYDKLQQHPSSHLASHLSSHLAKHAKTWLSFALTLTLIFGLQWLFKGEQTDPARSSALSSAEPAPGSAVSDSLNTANHSSLATAALAPVPSVGSIHALPDELKQYAAVRDFDTLRTRLLEQALQAVEQQDDERLANTMALLGLAAQEEQDLDSASVYLNEALALYEDSEDELGIASVSLHIGRMHILERRRARRAALAYDTSVLARWKIAHGYFHEAEASLKNAIEENLSLNRNGAAAIDYQSLYRGYLKNGNLFDAETAALAAARLHAGSGRMGMADKILAELQENSLMTGNIDDFKAELSLLHQDYQDSVNLLGRVRDYQQLYNHYIAKNDPVRAWRFRLKANASQQKASKRARYRRQSGVLVLLYNSNDSMRQAKSSLRRARALFQQQNQNSLAYQSTLLMSEVY